MSTPITKKVKDSGTGSYPVNEEVTKNADGSGGPVSIAKKKDACYHKAKEKYDVFPSAYASGYIAKCRKRKGKIN